MLDQLKGFRFTIEPDPDHAGFFSVYADKDGSGAELAGKIGERDVAQLLVSALNRHFRTPKTMQQLAADALACQDAPNILGLARSFATEVLPDLKAALEAGEIFGTDAIARHPVTQLWVSKLHSLSGMGLSDLDRYAVAEEACQHLAAGRPMKPLTL